MNISEFGIQVGSLPHGPRNLISDVAGVTVGHATIDDERSKTGVTVVLPCPGNVFRDKLIAASYVLNGFGKTLGLVQIDELGTLETPIALTNTLNVGLVHDALVEYSIGVCKKDGTPLRSVNPVVCECNDAALNDIQLRAVKKEHVFRAIESASADFALGDVGCGKGTTCHGLKGGVGSASRLIRFGNDTYTVGVLMQTNHGRLSDLMIGGEHTGQRLAHLLESGTPDKGSCITVVATDLPVSSRQLKRIIKRAAVGLIRNGSYLGHGSGDIFVGFTIANRLFETDEPFRNARFLNEDLLDEAFRACAEAAEEAVLSSLLNAETVTGFGGTKRYSLRELYDKFDVPK
ncbi:MAG: P1 family peptidase [Clostridia bacterium]|nr:P1 family peptidase [Clostridia bacterium]